MSELEQGTILIVDDNLMNLQVLFNLLSQEGFRILVAKNGESAIEKAQYSLPNLILLDVLMPGIDGFDTCKQLKADARTQDIPIIFMTALMETEHKIKGFSLGAVDYITKPFQHQEVLLRVKTHFSLATLTKRLLEKNLLLEQEVAEREKAQTELKNLTNALEKRVEDRTIQLANSNQQLKQEIVERQQIQRALEDSLQQLQFTQTQLVHSEKMSALGQMVAGVAHEINNPVNFMYGNIAYIQDYVKEIFYILSLYRQYYPEPALEIKQQSEAVELDYILDDLPKILDSMKMGGERIREIVLSLKIFARQDGNQMKATNIHEGLDSTLMILQNRLKNQPNHPAVKVIKNYSSSLPLVECFGGEMNQVFMNILANAIDAIEENSQFKTLEELKQNPNQITIETEVVEGHKIAIHIIDNGGGMNEETMKSLFQPFFTTKPPGKGTGIGLSISRQIVEEKHHGTLRCQSTLGSGTEFIIEIPIIQDDQNPDPNVSTLKTSTELTSNKRQF